MAAVLFLHDDHLAKVVLTGTSFLILVQYDRACLDNVKYETLLYRKQFPDRIIVLYEFNQINRRTCLLVCKS